MNRSRGWTRRGAWLIASAVLASAAVGCKDTGDAGESAGSKPPEPAASAKTPDGDKGKGDGKESAKPSQDASKKPGGSGSTGALTCDQLRNAELQNSSLRLPDAPEGTIALTDGRWEGDGVVIELQPQCGIGDMTGDPAADAVGAIKVTTGGTGKFYGLVTWRNDAGTPVPAAAASLGDRTPVVSVGISSEPPKQATVVYLTRGDSDPAAVVTLRRTAVYQVTGPAMVELHHSDAPYTP
ncbi:hypothetical protein OHS70_35695 [Streptomyces sp. NBC_00390]|uniref:hypothetical protein n=1 Tax=Streptomyces sp. NBC_00390 TaxID=2975736 RepID=UPI002E1E464E